MGDDQREAVRRFVYKHLPDRDFQQAFTAVNSDGERPILIAIREDLISSVLAEALAAGGAANVAVPLLKGVVVLAMTSMQVSALRDALSDPFDSPREIDADCTVGVFLQRMIDDAPGGEAMEYSFRVSSQSDRVSRSRAQAVFAGAH